MTINPVEALREFVATYSTQGHAADALGISPQYLCDLLAGRRTFSARVLGMLGLERVVIRTSADATGFSEGEN